MRVFTILILLICMALHPVYAQITLISNETGLFNEGLAPFSIDNRWGFIDVQGNQVIKPEFKAFVTEYGVLPYFSGGFTGIIDPNTEMVGYINKTGKVVIDLQYYSARPFSESVAIVGRQNDYILIDSLGNILATDFVSINGYISDFHNNRASVQIEFQSGYINKQGKLVIEAIYEDARDFSNGLAAVKRDAKWGFIDTSGIVKIPFQFSNEPKSFSCGRSFVQGSNSKWGILSSEGALIVEPTYDQVFPYNGGYAVVSQMDAQMNTSYSILDTNGKVVKNFPKASNNLETISLWSGCQEGTIVAMKSSKKGLIDCKGNVLVSFLYKDLKPMSCGLSYFERWDEKTKTTIKGFVDRTGKEVIHIESPKF